MAEYIDREKIFPNRIFYVNEENPLTALNALINHIYNLPTADVVPKSEYDAVVSAVDNSTKEFLKLHDDYQEAKSEVERLYYNLQAVLEERAETKQEIAREIFEEIEAIKCVGLLPSSWVTQFAELKKKYKEGKT